MKTKLRFIVYCPSQYRNKPPVFGQSKIMAMAEHSRPVYRVLDCAFLAKGNNPECPDHVTAKPVCDGLDYVAAVKKADELNAAPGAQRVYELTQELEENGCDTIMTARLKIWEAERLLILAKERDALAGNAPEFAAHYVKEMEIHNVLKPGAVKVPIDAMELQIRAAKLGCYFMPDMRHGCFNFYDKARAHAFCVGLREVKELIESEERERVAKG